MYTTALPGSFIHFFLLWYIVPWPVSAAQNISTTRPSTSSLGLVVTPLPWPHGTEDVTTIASVTMGNSTQAQENLTTTTAPSTSNHCKFSSRLAFTSFLIFFLNLFFQSFERLIYTFKLGFLICSKLLDNTPCRLLPRLLRKTTTSSGTYCKLPRHYRSQRC